MIKPKLTLAIQSATLGYHVVVKDMPTALGHPRKIAKRREREQAIKAIAEAEQIMRHNAGLPRRQLADLLESLLKRPSDA
jgi:hypothetical protein